MTTPSPYDTPGTRNWLRRGAAVPSGRVAPRMPAAAVAPKASVVVLGRAAVRGAAAVQNPALASMWLPLEGAAGSKVAIYNLDKSRPDLYIDGVRVKRESNGDFTIPMAQGRPQKLQARAAIPGYPTIKFQGKTLYKSPKPPMMYALAYVAVVVGALIFVGAFGGFALVGVAAMGAGYASSGWILKAKGNVTVLLGLLIAGVTLLAVGIAHMAGSGLPRF